jgi:hypothetical protein
MTTYQDLVELANICAEQAGRQEGYDVSTYRVVFDEHPSIILEPRTELQRTGIGDLTNCGRSQRHSSRHPNENRCQWMRMDRCGYIRTDGFGRICPQKNFSGVDEHPAGE